jgi:molybdopterin converting factor small subunit
MIVKVLYFAAAQDLASRKSELMEMARGSSVGGLVAEIMRAHPALRPLRRSIRLSVNLEVAEEDTALREGDEVGVLPPVAGG